MAWLFLAFCLIVAPNQALLDRLPRAAGLEGQDLLLALLALPLLAGLRHPVPAAPPPHHWLPRFLVALAVLSFVGLFTAAFFTPSLGVPDGLGDARVVRWRGELLAVFGFFLASRGVRTEVEMRRILVAVAIAAAAYVVHFVVLYFPIVDRVAERTRPEGVTDAAWVATQVREVERYAGVFVRMTAAEMGAFYTYVGVFFVGLGWEDRARIWRTIAPIEVAALLVGVAFAASAAALVAFTGAVAHAFFRQRRWVVRIAIASLALIGAVVPPGPVGPRVQMWGRALLLGVKHPLGVGHFAFSEKHRQAWGSSVDVGNHFAETFAELGIAGLALLVGCIALGSRLGWKLFDTGRTDFARGVGRGVAMMWSAVAIACMFGDRMRHLPVGLFVWSVTGLAFALLREAERARAEEALPLDEVASITLGPAR